MAEAVRGAVVQEMDTNILFEKFTIDEIREIEKKTRADIERKKEDLRQMVGERYRDLIEAADTITEMKLSAENVMSSISRMQELCQGLKNMGALSPVRTTFASKIPTARKGEDSQFYAIAVQIKILHDMPEKMWSSLESQNLLRATQLFLLARHINTSLQLDSQQAARIHNRFPVLSTQWAAIGHFRTTILQTCRETLKETNISDEVAAECLCSILLLEDSTPRQVFNELLLLRTTAVQQLFQSDEAGLSIKAQLCSVIQMIVTTVRQIYAVFYVPDDKAKQPVDCNLLMKTVEKVTDKGPAGAILTEQEFPVNMKHLPPTIREFRPTLRHHALPISAQNLHQNCMQWIQTCKSDVESGLDKLLGFITSVKGLAAIRDEVWTLLKQDEKMCTWEVVCERVLETKLSVWEEFFQSHFRARAKAILQEMFDTALTSSKSQIGKVLANLTATNDKYTEVERNLSSYVWTESPQDVPAHAAWVGVHAKTLADCGTLMMKAKAYTPAVQTLCRSFDGKLKVLLEDGSYYLRPAGGSTEGQESAGPFDKYADHDSLQNFLQSACKVCVNKLLDHLKQQMYASTQQLSSSQDPQASAILLDRLLLLGRFSCALTELSPYLQQCVTASTDKLEPRLVKKPQYGKISKVTESPHWTELRTKLNDFSSDAYNLWCKHIAERLGSQFSEALLDSSGQALLHSAMRWSEVEIQEETEDGKPLKSTIRVPMQPSTYLQSLLYSICEEINRVGGHALHRAILHSLVQQISDEIISQYEGLVSDGGESSLKTSNLALTQTRALQLLFDIKLLNNILPRKEDNQSNKEYQQRVQKVVDKIEGHIDPFDLDVFSPYVQSHLVKQTQRCQVLYGALTSLDKHGLYLGGKPPAPSGGQKEQHNIMPLSSNQSRFPLLPLSVQTRSSMPPPILQPPKPKGVGLGPSSPPPIIPTPQEEQASGFLGTMSTIWFSNVTGGKAK